MPRLATEAKEQRRQVLVDGSGELVDVPANATAAMFWHPVTG